MKPGEITRIDSGALDFAEPFVFHEKADSQHSESGIWPRPQSTDRQNVVLFDFAALFQSDDSFAKVKVLGLSLAQEVHDDYGDARNVILKTAAGDQLFLFRGEERLADNG